MCNKFNFKINLKNINYGKINSRYKHNVVLSLNDGCLSYKGKNNLLLNFPFTGKEVLTDNFLRIDESELPNAIINFLSALKTVADQGVLLDIDTTLYLTDDFY